MTPDEALKLCRLAKAFCPSQAVDEFTPEAWALALKGERFEDAQEALVQLARERDYINIPDIVRGVKKIRADRIREFGPFDPPPGLTEGEYREWLRGMNRRIGDGELTRDQYQGWEALPAREMPALEGVFQEVPNA